MAEAAFLGTDGEGGRDCKLKGKSEVGSGKNNLEVSSNESPLKDILHDSTKAIANQEQFANRLGVWATHLGTRGGNQKYLSGLG